LNTSGEATRMDSRIVRGQCSCCRIIYNLSECEGIFSMLGFCLKFSSANTLGNVLGYVLGVL
jgi:hypothetical protein